MWIKKLGHIVAESGSSGRDVLNTTVTMCLFKSANNTPIETNERNNYV